MCMKIEFDPNKSDKNKLDRGLSFDRAAEFDWETALLQVCSELGIKLCILPWTTDDETDDDWQ